jgi:hypothetical protein
VKKKYKNLIQIIRAGIAGNTAKNKKALRGLYTR